MKEAAQLAVEAGRSANDVEAAKLAAERKFEESDAERRAAHAAGGYRSGNAGNESAADYMNGTPRQRDSKGRPATKSGFETR